MKALAVVLRVLGYFWLMLAVLLIVVGIVGIWMNEGFSGVQGVLSPFNIVNWVVTLLTVAPGVGLLMLADRLDERR